MSGCMKVNLLSQVGQDGGNRPGDSVQDLLQDGLTGPPAHRVFWIAVQPGSTDAASQMRMKMMKMKMMKHKRRIPSVYLSLMMLK